jgi:hypothetical protein
MPRTSEALPLTAQYLNVIQTVHIQQQDSAVTSSLPEEDILHGNPTLLPNILAR